MTCHTSLADVLACLALAVSLFAGSLIPFFLLVDADIAGGWQAVCAFVARVAAPVRDALLDAAALLLLLTTSPKGAMA